MTQTKLSIEGMSCQNCVRHATEALTAVDGVSEASVILEPGSGVVTHAPTVTAEALIAALDEEGYKATVHA